MTSIKEIKKEMSDKKIAVADAIIDQKSDKEILEIIKEKYEVVWDKTANNILDIVKNDEIVQEYSWTKKKLIEVENNMLDIALNSEKEENRLKAQFFIHDKMTGKAQAKVDVTSGGEVIFNNIFSSVDELEKKQNTRVVKEIGDNEEIMQISAEVQKNEGKNSVLTLSKML